MKDGFYYFGCVLKYGSLIATLTYLRVAFKIGFVGYFLVCLMAIIWAFVGLTGGGDKNG
jgi:hypothetical protein